MKWPFVHRARLEAAEERIATMKEYSAALATNSQRWQGHYEKAMQAIQSMKRDGFQSLPPKIPPKPSDPETAFLAEQESIVDPLLAELVAEGHTLADARAIKRQAMADYKNGGM